LPDQAVSRLSLHREGHYAVPREAQWKKAVWRTVSAPPSQATPRPCAMPLARRWPTPTIRVGVRATPAPPAAAISWCWNASIARRTTGRWPASSSATCGSTTTCRFVTSERRVTTHRPASYATCSTRHSTRFGLPRRRSRSVATQPSGSKFFGVSLASTSKARNTAALITGPSGAGIGLAPARTSGEASNRPRSRRAHRDPQARRRGRHRSVATVPRETRAPAQADHHGAAHAQQDRCLSAAHAQRDRVARLSEVLAPAARMGLPRGAHGRVAVVDRIAQDVHPDQPAPAKDVTRASQKGVHERAY
jgi:hypothetical protein